ncbi:MAG: methionyl-tRNA formyltransferase [Candidatus Aminicenantes bacterium]|nr:methionyl-tRNA formyltransferase [Candidatus Aminicenantes bacterium]
MKTVFFGSPAAALPSLRALLEAGHVVALVVTQPDKPAGRGRKLQPSAVKAFALERGISVIEPAKIRTDEPALDSIRAAAPDINVVVAYGQIIPNAIHALPRHRSLNVHFSLLPKYRGAAPVQWAVLNGDAESGVTIIELDDRMDEGDILAVKRVPVGPRETARELEERLAGLGASLLLETIEHIDGVSRIAQDHSLASLAPKIKKEDGRIRWELNAVTVDRKVRALADRPGAYTFFKGRRIGILRGRKLETANAGLAPGTVLSVGKEGLRIACSGGTAFLVEELQPEGKSPMTAHVFSLGTKIDPGDLME